MILPLSNPIIESIMRPFRPQILLCLVALALVVPESYAKRLGGGRSVGRQSMSRQYAAPSPAPQRPSYAPPPARTQPDYARQQQAPARAPTQSSGVVPGMIGGALLGMGVGSMMSRDRPADPAQAVAPSSDPGAQGTATAPPANQDQLAATQQAAPESRTGAPMGGILLLGLIGLAVWFMRRRAKAR
jgi:hypothetical protein